MFKLLIECSKNIDSLSINFTDGTSAVSTSIPAHPPKVKNTEDKVTIAHSGTNAKSRREVFLNTDDDDDSTISQDIVQLPKIDIPDRQINVAPELQNLDF